MRDDQATAVVIVQTPAGFPERHKMIAVQLTDRQLAHATVEAAWREPRRPRGMTIAQYQAAYPEQVRGAAAELATAVALGLNWTGIAGRGAPDVDPFEIKSCRFWNPYNPPHLIIDVADVHADPRRPVVLVAGDDWDPAVFYVVGWTYCDWIATLADVHTNGGPPAYWFPAAELFSMDLAPAGVQLRTAPALLTVDQVATLTRREQSRPFVEALQLVQNGEASSNGTN